MKKNRVMSYNKPKMFYDIESLNHTDTVALIDDNNKRYLYVGGNSQPTDLQGAEKITLSQLKSITFDYELIGFNNSNYDDYIVASIIEGQSPEEIKKLSDDIINHVDMPWNLSKSIFGAFDIRTVIPSKAVSLKQLASQAGLDVEEYDLGFDVDADEELSVDQINRLIHYNFNDVVATKYVFHTNSIEGKFNTHVQMIEHYLPGQDYMISATDATLASRALTKKSKGFNKYQVIMKTKFDWMLNGHYVLDLVPEQWKEELLNVQAKMEDGMKKYEVAVAHGMKASEAGAKYLKVAVNVDPIKIGKHFVIYPKAGGLHSAYLNDDGIQQTVDLTNIHHRDISGAYGMLAIATNLFGPEITPIYEGFMKDKFEAKKAHDTGKIIATKLATNAPTGEADRPGSDLYNPIAMLEIRVMLQVVLYEACKLVIEHGGEVLSVNTDGLFYTGNEEKLKPFFDEWEAKWNLKLSYDSVDRYIGKDDNNRIIINNENLESVGGELNHLTFDPLRLGKLPRIVDNAVVRKLVYPEESLDSIIRNYANNNQTDLFAWTIKPTKGHRSVIDNKITQRINRVLLTTEGHILGNYSVVKDKVEKFNGLELNQPVTVINQGLPDKLPANLDIQAYVDLAQTILDHWN